MSVSHQEIGPVGVPPGRGLEARKAVDGIGGTIVHVAGCIFKWACRCSGTAWVGVFNHSYAVPGWGEAVVLLVGVEAICICTGAIGNIVACAVSDFKVHYRLCRRSEICERVAGWHRDAERWSTIVTDYEIGVQAVGGGTRSDAGVIWTLKNGNAFQVRINLSCPAGSLSVGVGTTRL